MDGTGHSAGQHHHIDLIRDDILLGDIAPHRDAVAAGDGLTADAHRLNGDAAPPQNIHRGQRLHFLKALCQKYISCHRRFLLASFLPSGDIPAPFGR